ncbi:MAG: hypothetical protein HPY90_15500 [Syntrophothermus sp.]|uniref:hypothetical protein n=1 Tax=Syntrophothermus sp. TaxID=2736299 RepID=UPI00257B38C6|nr:hypothetical protein [Syntrophothermus sp.]NSW84599.1 hypothetical protein [Syntrophothermus sp.]
MILTKKQLKIILENMRISIPANLEKELLVQYGNLETDDEGHVHEYTEQDICEQLEKKLRPYGVTHLTYPWENPALNSGGSGAEPPRQPTSYQ